MVQVVLASMPFVALERPSVALGTLAACLKRDGITTRTVYGNLAFAERIGVTAYLGYDNSDITLQLGEWVFSECAYRVEGTPAADLYRGLHHCEPTDPGQLRGLIESGRLAAAVIEDLAVEILGLHPVIVGCSSVFQQQCASLALLRRIKELAPEVVTMLGGANCEGDMGATVHMLHPWVDFVVSGEADILLPQLCRDIFEYGPDVPAERLPASVYGPACRGAKKPGGAAPRAVVRDLDDLPVPDYQDYFDHLHRSRLRDYILPALPVETSRGCWWGEKHHCTFCGLNGHGISFRSKSADRALAEIAALGQTYGLSRFMTVDNILDTKYFDALLPALAARGDGTFFYEIKANLRRDRVEALSRAGIRWVQPGIEALHDDLLRLLNKGATTAINVQLLKWARLYGVWVIWNHLSGAPGDRDDWYDEIAAWLPAIFHLQPPASQSIGPIRFDRFSPYFDHAVDYGLDLRPYGTYAWAYPLSGEHLADHAYFFYDVSRRPVEPMRLKQAVVAWSQGFFDRCDAAFPTLRADAPILSMTADADGAVIVDTRPVAGETHYRLSPIEAAVCRACDAAARLPKIAERLTAEGFGADEAQLRRILGGLLERRLVLRFGEAFLCVALDQEPIPYMSFELFAGGLTLLSKRPRAAEETVPAAAFNPPLRELFCPA